MDCNYYIRLLNFNESWFTQKKPVGNTLCMARFFLMLVFFPNVLIAQELTEICASKSAFFEHPVYGESPWLELHNPTAEAIDLTNWYLTDHRQVHKKWVFPDTVIHPFERLVIPIVDNTNNVGNITNYSINQEGPTLYLMNTAAEVVDSIQSPALRHGHSYGKIENQFYYFRTPTPGEENLSIGFKGYASAPEVNRSSGKLKPGSHVVARNLNENETIYVSQNGGATVNICNQPIIFKSSATYWFISRGDSLIDSVPVSRTYFKKNNYGLPLVSLTLDSLSFFDADNGIYMLGPTADSTYPFSGANYFEDIAIPVHYNFFDAKGMLQEELFCELEIHGGLGSRIRAMKSLCLKAKKEVGQKTFNYPYFKGKELRQYKRLVLRNGGNDFCHTGSLDAVLHSHFMDNHLNVDLSGYQPVVVYINEEYWGVYNLREKMDRHYIATNYGISADSVNILENRGLNEVEGSNEGFLAVIDYVEANGAVDEMHYNWVKDRLDITSMIDYFIIELYLNNKDWPNNNLKVWNAPHRKWRYLCYDLDVAFVHTGAGLEELENFRRIMTHFTTENPHVFLFSELLKNQDFLCRFVNRYADLLNTAFRPQKLVETFEKNRTLLKPNMKKHYEKWCGSFDIWAERFNGLYGSIFQRKTITQHEISSVLGMADAVPITLDTYPVHGIKLKVNTIHAPEIPFGCHYYPDVPIQIEPIAENGLMFKHWENLKTGRKLTTRILPINPQENDHWLAVFEPRSIYDMRAYPNPFNNQLKLTFANPTSGYVTIQFVKPDGRIVQTIYAGECTAGTHQMSATTNDLINGVYLLVIQSSAGNEALKIIKNNN